MKARWFITALLVVVAVALAGKLTLSGQQYYSLTFDQDDAVFIASGDSVMYDTKQWYFNSANTSTDPVDYSGYASVWVITPTTVTGTMDSCYITGWLTDQYGRRLLTDSLDIATNVTWTAGDTFNYKLDEVDGFDLAHGVLLKFKHFTADSTDSCAFKAGIWFEGR